MGSLPIQYKTSIHGAFQHILYVQNYMFMLLTIVQTYGTNTSCPKCYRSDAGPFLGVGVLRIGHIPWDHKRNRRMYSLSGFPNCWNVRIVHVLNMLIILQFCLQFPKFGVVWNFGELMQIMKTRFLAPNSARTINRPGVWAPSQVCVTNCVWSGCSSTCKVFRSLRAFRRAGTWYTTIPAEVKANIKLVWFGQMLESRKLPTRAVLQF
jgi:hypothetical protein